MSRAFVARREFQAAFKQCLRLFHSIMTLNNICQQAQRNYVGRMLFDLFAQQGFGFRNAVLSKCSSRLPQVRVICRIANIHGKGIIRSVPVSQRGQKIRQRKPGVAKIRFYGHGAAHRSNRRFVLP